MQKQPAQEKLPLGTESCLSKDVGQIGLHWSCSCEFCEFFLTSLFAEHIQATASGHTTEVAVR